MPRPLPFLRSPPSSLTPASPGWPASLARLPDPPARLRIAGELPSLVGAVAVVGTRYASDDALDFAHELGRALAAVGRTVISGGALGVDAAAHRGALEGGGATVAVLATGFDRPYPPSHGPLFARIADRGALLTENDDGSPPVGFAFLARNRLIAALAEAVVVVQAPARSGALSTAALAKRLEKPVFAVPYAPWEVRGEGCVRLLRTGALICTSVRDVLSVRPHSAATAPFRQPSQEGNPLEFDGLDDDAQAVLRALGKRPKHPDKLASGLGMSIMKVQQALLELLLRGQVVERSPGAYALSRDANRT
ncbi:MAG: DNA-processing protein DprA [Polyangiales bacterium]